MFTDLPVELVHNVLDLLPSHLLYGLIGNHNNYISQVAFDHYYKDIVIDSDFTYSAQGNYFANVSSLKRFLQAFPDYHGQTLTLNDSILIKQLSPSELSRFNYVSLTKLNNATDTLPDVNYKLINSKDYDQSTDNFKSLSSVETAVFENSNVILNDNIRSLTLANCQFDHNQLNDLHYLQELKTDSFNDSWNLQLPNLKHLTLKNFKNGDFSNCPNLKSITLDNVNDLSKLNLPTGLQHLSITDGPRLKSLEGLDKLVNLTRLDLSLYYVISHSNFYHTTFPNSLKEFNLNLDQAMYYDIFEQINELELPSNLLKFSLTNCEDLILGDLKLPETLQEAYFNNISGFAKNFYFPNNLKKLSLNNLEEFNEDFLPFNLTNLEINECCLSSAPFHYLLALKQLTINDGCLVDLLLPTNLQTLNLNARNLKKLTLNNHLLNANLTTDADITYGEELKSLTIKSNKDLDLNGVSLNHLQLNDFDKKIQLPAQINSLTLNNSYLPIVNSNMNCLEINNSKLPILNSNLLSLNLKNNKLDQLDHLPRSLKYLNLENNEFNNDINVNDLSYLYLKNNKFNNLLLQKIDNIIA